MNIKEKSPLQEARNPPSRDFVADGLIAESKIAEHGLCV
jgi:hypothetical protein